MRMEKAQKCFQSHKVNVMKLHGPLLIVLIFLIMAGCTVGPDYRRPETAVPKQWHNFSSASKDPQGQLETWWKSFNDPVLDQLIVDAITANLDLKQALARIEIARTERSATLTAVLPSLSARSNLSRRFNNTTGGAQTGGSNVGGGFGIGSQHINIFQMGFDAQWELDFFGGIRRSVEEADAKIEAETENNRDILVTVLAEVARNYIDLRANQNLLSVSRETLSIQQDLYTLTQVRQQAGLANTLDVAQAQAQLDNTEAVMPIYETQVKQLTHALAILLGREPGALSVKLAGGGSVPVISSKLIVDLPSELLQRRPDIRRAERQMASANAAIGVATAELYPKVNLAAFLGLQNLRITDITPIGKSWSSAASLSMPIFNWGKINANIKSKKIQYEQTFINYRYSVLNAFREVEDGLVAYTQEQARNKSLVQSVEANRLTVKLANERYFSGLTSFLDVIEAQQRFYQAQTNLVTSEAKISNNLVAIYKSMGGGWQT
jgi:outer membrane protein, multidrug efflux system